MDSETLYKYASELANSLGIALYIRDGHIHQDGPGERVDPPRSAHVTASVGRFEGIRVAPNAP